MKRIDVYNKVMEKKIATSILTEKQIKFSTNIENLGAVRDDIITANNFIVNEISKNKMFLGKELTIITNVFTNNKDFKVELHQNWVLTVDVSIKLLNECEIQPDDFIYLNWEKQFAILNKLFNKRTRLINDQINFLNEVIM